jgi:cytidyltransferase-like protein
MSKRVLVYGVWDLFHNGHYQFLNNLTGYGDELIIGVLCDELAEKFKRRPIMNVSERVKMVKNMGYFHDVFIVTENNYEEAMRIYNPDLVVHGSDNIKAPSIETAKRNGIKTKIVKYTKGISTTEIIKRCKNA